jgi:hypothetical protein
MTEHGILLLGQGVALSTRMVSGAQPGINRIGDTARL